MYFVLYLSGFFSLVLSFGNFINPNLYDLLMQEDNLIENLTVFCFFISTFILIKTLGKTNNRKQFYFLSVLAISFLFAAMEELSWGQRIFNLHTPDRLAQINTQGELNFHNLSNGDVHISHFVSEIIKAAIVVKAILYVLGIQNILGINVASIPVILMFFIAQLFGTVNEMDLIIFFSFVVLLLSSIYKKRFQDVWAMLFFIVFILLTEIMLDSYIEEGIPIKNSINEHKEFLISLVAISVSMFYHKESKMKPELAKP